MFPSCLDHSVGDAADVSDPAAEATAKQPKMSKTKAALQKKLQSKLEQVKVRGEVYQLLIFSLIPPQ